MAVVPRAARPTSVLRRTALKRGGKGGNLFWRALAAYFVGGWGMLRSQAIRNGILGSSRFWRVILAGVLLRGQLTRQPESIATERLKAGQFLTVRVDRPLGRKEQERTGITRRLLEQRALADVAAAKRTETAP